MAKHKAFEELLNTQFRWPVKGDKAFVIANNPCDNAKIAVDGFARLVLMLEGYKMGADLMVLDAEKDVRNRDLLIFPIIFNYRQFLELSLKYQLATHGPKVGIGPNWKSHKLEVLWSEFREMLEKFGTPDPDEVDPVVGKIILEFAKIDPDSFSHRYPVDRHGALIPIAVGDLHLPTLADVVNGVAGYFSGTDGYLSAL